MRIIFLIMIGLSILDADFTKSGNIVRDSATTLEWQDNAIGSIANFNGAISRCEALDLDGKSDWRLPNINELLTTMDDTRTTSPLIYPVFQHTKNSYYQSSTTSAKQTDKRWTLLYTTGYQDKVAKTSASYVRCVRGGQ